VPFHLAQVNIALPREPLDAPLLAEFVARLEPVNAAADAAPGFIWRLQTEDGDATGIKAFGDDRLIVNMSVWESLEALRVLVYTGRMHVDVLRRRREWFERLGEAHVVLWWVTADHVPSVEEAEERLALLRQLGATRNAFTFREHFPPPDAETNQRIADDRELCPAG
jgi:Domain of unknown function (DUF3291)